MKNKWLLLLVAMLASLALVSAACGPAADDDDGGAEPTEVSLPPVQPIQGSSPTAVPEVTAAPVDDMMNTSVSGVPIDDMVRTGGILRNSYTREGPTFSTWEEAAGIAFPTMHPLHNVLIRARSWGTEEDFRNNAFFELKPDLAHSWEISGDGETVTFNLRDGIEWSDGTALTCADVKWSYDTVRTSNNLRRSPRGVHFNAVESIECPDDLTVVFNLKWAKPAILEVIGMPYHIIRPAHVYEGTDLEALRNDLPTVTSGAYTITQWNPGERYVFEKNPDYWDQPLPHLDGIELRLLGTTAIPTALRAGRLHIGNTSGFTGAAADTLIQECSPDVCRFWPRVIASSLSPALFLNKNRTPWNEPAINTAFALAIDNQNYITTVRNDWYQLPTGCGFYPTSPWAMPQERCGTIPGFGDVIGVSTPEEDKEQARQILADAGYGPGGEQLELQLAIWQPIEGDAPAFLADLSAIGINVEADIMESARAYTNWSEGNFDVGVHSFWIAGLDPDITLYEHFYTGSDRNYNRYSSVEFDNLVDEMSRTVDPEARKQLAWDAMELALRDVGKIVVSHSTYVPTTNVKLMGLMPGLNYLASYGPSQRYDHVWIAE